jgi:membrane-associated phospholipid phosphatase
MNKSIANTVSWVAHPLLMPTFLFVLLKTFVPGILEPMGSRVSYYVLLLIFITTFLIPVLSLLGLRGSGSIARIKLENRRDRLLPFSFITLFYFITAYLFRVKLDINPMLQEMLISISVIVLLVTLITFFWKVSIHAAGAGGLAGFILALTYLYPDQRLYLPFAGILIISGIILSSRLKLNAHSPGEVYVGFMVGLAISFTSLFI